MRVCLFVRKVYQDIVKVSDGAREAEVTQGLINRPLKGGWSVLQTKRHNPEPKTPAPGTNGGEPLLALCDSSMVKGVDEILH